MTKEQQHIAKGMVHEAPSGLKRVLNNSEKARELWNGLTPLARNEWICWIISVKKPKSRKKHIDQACEMMLGGKRRPCCIIITSP